MCSIVLVTYLNRSGSSFLFEQVSKSLDVITCLEAEVLIYELLLRPHKHLSEYGLNCIFDWIITDPKLSSWNLTKEDITDLDPNDNHIETFTKILKCYARKVKPTANTIFFKGTKLIDFFLNYQDIIKENNFHTLCILRDPRAVFNSQKSNLSSIARRSFSYNPLTFVFEWNSFTKKVYHLKQNKKTILLIYDEIIKNPQSIICKLSSIIPQINYEDEQTGDYFSRLPYNQVHLHKNIIAEANAKRVKAWEYELDKIDALIVSKLANNQKEFLPFTNYFYKVTTKDSILMVFYIFFYFLLSFKKAYDKFRYKLMSFFHIS